MPTLTLHTQKPRQWIDITDDVARAVRQSGVQDGLCLVFSPHTTASVVLNEHWDPQVVDDVLRWLEQQLPATWPHFRHLEGNSAAHLLCSWFGSAVTVPIAEGGLALGRWQGIFFAEWDGPRTRQYRVDCVGTPRP
ncbi:MAG: secondary thiamine-phosphate synthase enzyme YjbQ [Firmicutes bacterium]|nr:YjbQ family protein [Alicyclobacillaceae bacterium]MCL6496850.1 secondary thiamine-phosphate synthase enzyme YjbQ [Bacillota bacterium]